MADNSDDAEWRPARVPQDLRVVVQAGLALALALLEASDGVSMDLLVGLERAATDCARTDIPIETVLHALHDSVAAAIRRQQAGTQGRPIDTAAVVELLGVLTTAVARSYVLELCRTECDGT
ncbi:hypothetical protein [Nocardia sp. BMG51109]|uniref:hypothetical protein n=1 Tax=Nocardia sp. BMG51109 TaxID=1056816 RepID=UPI00046494B3|nr:hypothetical protein [Nocardia sp. BMG51109]